MIKLIIFDIDNTLALPNQPIDERIVRQLKMIESQGIKIALISGKPSCYISGFARQLGLQKPIIIGENGAVIYTSTKFPPEQELFMIDIKEKENLLLSIESLKNSVIRKYKESVWLQPNLVNLTIFPKTPGKNVLNDIKSHVEETLKNEQDNFAIYLHCDSLEVVPKSINKGDAFKKLLKVETIRKEEVIAVGDGENDIPMLKEAGLSIGINLAEADFNFKTIDEAIDFILSRTNIIANTNAFNALSLREAEGDEAISKNGLLRFARNDNYCVCINSQNDRQMAKLEYEQVCSDWRHRDTMLWSVLAIAVTLAGMVFVVLEKSLGPWNKLAIYFLSVIFSVACLVKITKDHFYQSGSSELMDQIFPNLKKELKIEDNPRKHRPTIAFTKERPFLAFVYDCMAKESTFDILYITVISLIVITILLIMVTIMSLIFNKGSI